MAELTSYVKAKDDKAGGATWARSAAPSARCTSNHRAAVSRSSLYGGSNSIETWPAALGLGMQDPQFSSRRRQDGAHPRGERRRAPLANPDLQAMANLGVPGIDLMGWLAAMVPPHATADCRSTDASFGPGRRRRRNDQFLSFRRGPLGRGAGGRSGASAPRHRGLGWYVHVAKNRTKAEARIDRSPLRDHTGRQRGFPSNFFEAVVSFAAVETNSFFRFFL